MLLSKKALSRRSLLRGMGASLALPALDAMVPSLAQPLRLAFVYVPNGIIMKHWTPATEGRDYAMPAAMEPVAAYREQLLVLSGLSQKNGRALGDGPGLRHSREVTHLCSFRVAHSKIGICCAYAWWV